MPRTSRQGSQQHGGPISSRGSSRSTRSSTRTGRVSAVLPLNPPIIPTSSSSSGDTSTGLPIDSPLYLNQLLNIVRTEVRQEMAGTRPPVIPPTPVPDTTVSLGSLPPSPTIASVATLTNPVPTPTTISIGTTHPSLVTSHLTGLTAGDLLNLSQPPTTAASGMILSSSIEPIPPRLVQRIQSGQFVEMRELLSDNLALFQQMETLHGQASWSLAPPSHRPRTREVPSLVSWLFCFITYVAVKTTDPITKDMLAYCHLIIREALRHGGTGWQEYDRIFRQQLAIDHTLPWNALQPCLQASTILGQRSSRGTFCSLCRGVDHGNDQCALRAMQPPPTTAITAPSMVTHYSHRFPCQETRARICISWNRGACVYPGTCAFQHICATCQRPHRARECPENPAGSLYKRSSAVPRPTPLLLHSEVNRHSIVDKTLGIDQYLSTQYLITIFALIDLFLFIDLILFITQS